VRRFRRFRLRLPSWQPRRTGRRGGGRGGWLLKSLVLTLAAGYLAIRLMDWILLEPLALVAETEARVRGIDAVNRVVLGSLGRSLGRQEMVTYEKDQEGRIAAYHINTQVVNAVAAEAAQAVEKEFRALSESPFGVPMGALSGVRLLASQGPSIPVKLMPIGTVAVDLQHDFKGEGINQTRHRIWLRATARMRVILPVVTKEVEVTADLPLSETVIIGPVPDSFYGGPIGGLTIPPSR
jgi:sporulation protein YunB